MKLRNYQINAVNAIFEAWQKFKSVLVVLPTGCGKTVVFASVIKRLLSDPVVSSPVVSSWSAPENQLPTTNQPTTSPADAAAARRALIAASSKPSCLIVDFVGNSGRHKLVTTLDILGGKDIDEEAIRTRARKIIEASPDGTDTADAIAEARKEIAERKARDAKRREFIQASAKFVEIEVDPFNIYDLPPVERMANDRTRRLSLKQEMLLRTRLHVDPRQLGYARSNQLLQEFFRRANSGLASLPQSKLLKRFGIDVPLRSDEAKRIIDRCLASSKR